MPSSHQPSFAAAASGAAGSRDSRGGRGDGRGSGDWPRRSNGAVLGRRQSSTQHSQSSQFEPTTQTTAGAEIQDIQSQMHPSSEPLFDTRYSKETMLGFYNTQQTADTGKRDVSNLFVGNWDPGHSNGTNGRGWGKSHDGRDTNGPQVCWDPNGSVQPISLEEMSEEDRINFASDVNSPLKPPPQNSNKDSSAQGGANGRKASISHGQIPNNFGLSSPASSRPTTARRQATADSITGLGSPATSGRFFRDENSPFLTRRPTDLRDVSDDREDPKNSLPFGGLIRSNTAGTAPGNGSASPWGTAPVSGTMSPMGTFGSFALSGTSTNQPSSDKRPAYGSMRGESRFAQLMHKDSSEDMSKTVEKVWKPRQRTDTDPFGDDTPTGSAALDGGNDTSPPLNSQRRAPGTDTPTRGVSGDFGMSEMLSFRGQRQQTPQGQHVDNDAMSPSDTNPYRSPPENDHDETYDGEPLLQGRGQSLGGIPEHTSNPFGNIPRTFSGAPFDGSDRSQTSSAGAPKGFPNLGGLPSLGSLGGIGGWPTSGNPIATPDRENRSGFSGAFGNSIFSPMGDLQSPGLGGGIGGIFGQPSNTVGRGSKLGSLFPAAMQAQMQGNENESPGDGGDVRQSSTFGAIGRNAFPPSRDTDSPMRASRGAFDDMFAHAENARNQGPFSSSEVGQGQTVTAFPPSSTSQPNYQQSQTGSDSASNQLPTAQQRMMVMPDRMRWVYLDPNGQVQGPWSGLEMHDWYKASFFTADLSVRKLEDTEFEPLGQLIRRIGNSREPFLVPQIGIPHGPPSTQAATPFAPAAAAPGNGTQPGSVQPPFAGAFPSFGTTLTAEQQNNLERRKQEEQYLMARQREFLAQQQVNMKQMQMSGLPASLHHQGSAGSLHSQPSFGSMTSPMGMPQHAPIPGVPGFFDRQAPTQATGGMNQDFFRDEDLARLSLQERQELFVAGAPGSQTSQPTQPTHSQQINAIFGQQSEAQREMVRIEQLRQNDPSVNPRLYEFHQLRAQEDAGQSSTNLASEPIGPPPQSQEPQQVEQEDEPEPISPEVLSLTQQVQKAASGKQSPASASQPESPWGKVNNSSMPMPFPPPLASTTPLLAPTAQRGRSNLPEALNVGIRSRSETPEVVATPSVAPWAKEPTEAPKGPSLKEIQELEAKQAARQEEIAAAARRVQQEQERKMFGNQPVAPAPGLPTSSTWATASPATSNAPSVWATPAKTQIASSSSASKKTLSDIQREEETRKKRLAAASAAAQPAAATSGGKRYADLASKPTATTPAVGGSWSTVGAGGKVKIPAGLAAVAPGAVRAVSSITLPTVAPHGGRPAPVARSVTQSGANSAKEEFSKWAKATLSKGLNSDVDVDDFISMISGFPLDAIIDAVYSSSQLMDGRHFAEEFIRRRKLADKGVVEPSNSGSGGGFAATSGSGGWNEVAKKGPPKEESTAGFKVIKKKGKR